MFVDGCFWHACPKHGTIPKTRTAFWHRKLYGNRRRDILVSRILRDTGWTVLRLWEHETETNVAACVQRRRAAVA